MGTLSACDDDDDEEEDDDLFAIQRDTVLDVGEVGSSRGRHPRLGSSRSFYSVASISSLIEEHRNRDGLTPPPRVITMRDKETGAEVVTEWQSQHSLRSHSAGSTSPSEKGRLPVKSTLPKLPKASVEISPHSSAGSHHSSSLSKYPALEPIRSRERSRRRKGHKHA